MAGQPASGHFGKPAGFTREKPVAMNAHIDPSLRIDRQGRGQARRQTLPRLHHLHGLRTQLHQAAAKGAQPEVPFAVLANGPHIIGPMPLPENHRLKTVVRKTEQAPAARADPQPPVAPLAQTPDANGGRLGTPEIIKPLPLRQVDQVRVAERPQIPPPVLVHPQIFRAAPLAVRLQFIGNKVSVHKPAHPTARRDPHRARPRHIHARDKQVRQPLGLGEPLEGPIPPPVQPGWRAHPHPSLPVRRQTRHALIQQPVGHCESADASVGQFKQTILLRANPQTTVAVLA